MGNKECENAQEQYEIYKRNYGEDKKIKADIDDCIRQTVNTPPQQAKPDVTSTNKKKETASTPTPSLPPSVRGRIVTNNGGSLRGAVIRIKGKTISTVSEYSGQFELSLPDFNSEILEISLSGYKPEQVFVSPGQNITVQLEKEKSPAFIRKSFFLGYSGSSAVPINTDGAMAGISLGQLKHEKIGWYFSIRMSPRFVYPFLCTATYQITENDDIRDPFNDDYLDKNSWTFNDKSYKINVNAALGITRRISDPLWFYLGAGISWDNVIRSFTYHDATLHAKYKSKETLSSMLDVGLSLRLGRVIVNGGISPKAGLQLKEGGFNTISFEECNITFGCQMLFKSMKK